MLSNILVTLPVRKTKGGTQVHKAREIFWSLFLVGLNLLATALITSALINKNWYLPQHSTDADNSMFFREQRWTWSQVRHPQVLLHLRAALPALSPGGLAAATAPVQARSPLETSWAGPRSELLGEAGRNQARHT